MQPPLIGILAGMGPRSTAPFVDMVVAECQRQYGAAADIDFPPMLIFSLPTPFSVDRPIDHAALERAIGDGLRYLERCGASFIAMPCNSAHRYYAALARQIGVPLLDMIAEARRDLPPAARRLALLATRPTVEAGLYQRALEADGRAVLHEPAWQRRVDQLLVAIKSGQPPARLRARWRALLGALAGASVDAALVACTDLNVIAAPVSGGPPLVDATRSLAAATVRTWLEQRGAAPPTPRAAGDSAG